MPGRELPMMTNLPPGPTAAAVLPAGTGELFTMMVRCGVPGDTGGVVTDRETGREGRDTQNRRQRGRHVRL